MANHEVVVAAREGHTEVVKGYLEKRSLQPQSDKCERALVTAVQYSRIDIMRLLLDYNVNPTSKADGFITICICAEKGLVTPAKLLLAHKADWSVRNTDGATAMSIAVHKKPPQLDVAKELLRAGARVGPTDSCVGLAAVVKEVQMEKLADELRLQADIKVSQAEVASVEEEVWRYQREHMRLLSLKEEQKNGVLLIEAEKRVVDARAEARECQKSEEKLSHDLNEKKVQLLKVTSDLKQLVDDLEEAAAAEAKARAERDQVAEELAAEQGKVQAALAEKAESDRLREASERARDEAIERTSLMETEMDEARRRRDLLNSELRDAEREYRNWMRAKDQAAAITAQAHRLLATN